MGNEYSAGPRATIKFSEVTIRNKLDKKITNVSLVYAAGDKCQARDALATDYWLTLDGRTIDIVKGYNTIFKSRVTIKFDDIKSKGKQSGKSKLEVSTYFRGYWMVYFTYNGVVYKINKNNAMCNPWPMDRNTELEITIMKEEEYIRINFLMTSGHAYFYATPAGQQLQEQEQKQAQEQALEQQQTHKLMKEDDDLTQIEKLAIVMQQTGCENVQHINQVFEWNNNDLEKTVKYLLMEYDEWGSDCWHDKTNETENDNYNKSNKKEKTSNDKDIKHKKEQKEQKEKKEKEKEKSRVIKHGLVLNICISKYGENGFGDLEGPKHDMNKLIDLWENRFGYEILCNDYDANIKGYYVSKNDFLQKLDECRMLLRSNDNYDNYDGLIFVFSGHGYGTSIVTSDSLCVSIDKIKRHFGANQIPEFKDKPKIYIFDCCRNKNSGASLPFEDNSRLVSHRLHDVNFQLIEEKEERGLNINAYENGNNNSNLKFYHPFSNTIEVYGNTQGYAVSGSKKGGSLITLITNHLSNCAINDPTNKILSNKTFQQLLYPVQREIHNLQGGNQTMEIVNRSLGFDLYLSTNDTTKW